MLGATRATTAALSLAACGNGNAPGGDLAEDEVAALVEALTTAGVPPGADQFLLGPVLSGAELGTIGEHDAVGAQVDYTVVNGTQEGSFRWIGVTGWSGFDAGAGTVANAFGAMYSSPTDGFPASASETIENGDVIVWSHQASPRTNCYPGATGTFVMTSASFGAPEDCPEVPELGNDIEGTGPETFVFPGTTYDVPATRVEITIDFRGAAARRGTR
jgi:hypothetical protein